MPELVRDTLLVVQSFKSDGVEYLVGDHVPTRHRAIRRVAAAHPEWFRMEYETAEVDLAWLAEVEAEAEERYEAVQRLKKAEEGRRERALREELKEQDMPQPELERRFKEQEQERKRREQEVSEEREREALEAQTAPLAGGFHY
jgi:hypothetical protein